MRENRLILPRNRSFRRAGVILAAWPPPIAAAPTPSPGHSETSRSERAFRSSASAGVSAKVSNISANLYSSITQLIPKEPVNEGLGYLEGRAFLREHLEQCGRSGDGSMVADEQPGPQVRQLAIVEPGEGQGRSSCRNASTRGNSKPPSLSSPSWPYGSCCTGWRRTPSTGRYGETVAGFHSNPPGLASACPGIADSPARQAMACGRGRMAHPPAAGARGVVGMAAGSGHGGAAGLAGRVRGPHRQRGRPQLDHIGGQPVHRRPGGDGGGAGHAAVLDGD